METEELVRCHPVDAAVLLGGCDKTTPGLLMGAISADIPSIYVPAGFMLSGSWRGERLGSSSAGWKYGQKLMDGKISFEEFLEIEQTCAPTVGTCNDMGTASTMTALAEVLGFSLPGASSVPAVDALGMRLAFEAGRRIVEMAWGDLKPSDMLTEAAFRNAAAVCAALGGSTNAAIHLIALAGRAGVKLSLDDLDAMVRGVPVLANVHPSGEYLMEDFYWAGGIRALMSRIQNRLALNCATVNGRTLGENIEGAQVHNAHVIRPMTEPIAEEALAVLRGNLAPDGCVRSSRARPARRSSGTKAAPSSSRMSMTSTRGSTTPTWRWMKTACWLCGTKALKAGRAYRSAACCRFRRSLLSRGSGTWFASAMPG